MSTVCVVTGAAGAMGTACALALAPSADVIVLTDLDESRLATAAATVERASTTKVEAMPGDIATVAFVEQLAARADALGELWALVHTAGLSPTMADWREILRVDLGAVCILLDTFVERVTSGSVAVCVASIAGRLGSFDPAMDDVCDNPLADDFEQRFTALAGSAPDPGMSYRLAKRAVIRRCERAAVGWGERGGRVLSLSPGLIDTPMGRLELEHNEVKKWMAELTPVGGDRSIIDVVLPGQADDIAQTVAFLASERAAFISGCDILVDGGLLAAMRQRSPAT